jgi:hypothetical protein
VWYSLSPWWAQLGVFLLATAAGISLHMLRDRLPRPYAALEFTLGEVAIWSALGHRSSSALESALKLATGVYLLVRALHNWMNGPERSQRSARRAEEKHREQQEAKKAKAVSEQELAHAIEEFMDRET